MCIDFTGSLSTGSKCNLDYIDSKLQKMKS